MQYRFSSLAVHKHAKGERGQFQLTLIEQGVVSSSFTLWEPTVLDSFVESFLAEHSN